MSYRKTKNKKPDSVYSTRYFYKDRTGKFKPLYAHKFLRKFGGSGRRSYSLMKTGKSSRAATFHGKMYTKSQIKIKKRQISKPRSTKRKTVRQTKRRISRSRSVKRTSRLRSRK